MPVNAKSIRLVSAAALLSALYMAPISGWAVPIPVDLTITGQVSLDTANTLPPVGGATQTGSMFGVGGGSIISPTLIVDGAVTSGPNPVSTILSDIGDGMGIAFVGAGDTLGEEVTDFFGDYAFGLGNASLVNSFVVTFKVTFDNTASTTGPDSFAETALTMDNDTTATEVFFTELTSDTFNGNDVNGVDPGTVGGTVTDVGPSFFDITVGPGASIDLAGLISLRGGAFGVPGTFGADIDTFVSIDGVATLAIGGPVPEPATLALFALGLAGFGLLRRRGRNITSTHH